MTTLAKASSILGGGVAGAGGVYGVYKLTESSTTIEQQLIKENRVILNTEGDTDDTVWKTKFTPDSNNKAETFAGWEANADENKKIAALKTACKAVLKKEFTSDKDSNYSNAKELCSRESTIKEMLSKDKSRVILDATGTTSDSDWTTKATSTDTSGKMKIFAGWTDGTIENSAKITAIKKKCEEVLKKSFIVKTNEDYANAKEYCTKAN